MADSGASGYGSWSIRNWLNLKLLAHPENSQILKSWSNPRPHHTEKPWRYSNCTMTLFLFCHHHHIPELYLIPRKLPGKFFDLLLYTSCLGEHANPCGPHPEPAEGPEPADGWLFFHSRTYDSRFIVSFELRLIHTFYGIIIPFGGINIPFAV